MSIKRQIVARVESILGVRVPRPYEVKTAIRSKAISYMVRPGEVGLLFEQLHLKKFFETYAVDCVFDVGANRGQYADMLRSKVGYKGLIISYEPNPEALRLLQRKASKDPGWHVIAAALDEFAGRRTFNVMRSDVFSSLNRPTEREVSISWLNNLNTVENQVEVETRTLAQEFDRVSSQYRFKHPYLKMDTQGHDIAVAKGGVSIISQFIGIQSEMAFKKLYEHAIEFTVALEFYRSHGFELSALVPNNEGHFPHLIELDGIFIRRDLTSIR